MAGRIRKWHFGKLIILGVWVIPVSVMMLRDFSATPVRENFVGSSIELVVPVLLLTSLSIVVWIWLGGKEQET